MQAPPVSSARSSIADSVCLDGYVLQEVIAESRAAIVYRAIDESLKLPVAIKEYLPQRFARRDAAARIVPLSPAQAAPFERGLRAFVDEARTLARCDHPSLVRVLRLIEANGTAYSVMPYYVGATLAEVRRGMSAAPDEAALRALLEPLLGALEEFHRIGGAHGGVRADNILLLRDDRPVLLGPGATSHEIGADRIEALMAYLQPPSAHRGRADAEPVGLDTDFRALAEIARFCIVGPSPAGAAGGDDSADGASPGASALSSAHGSASPHYSAPLLAAFDAVASPLPRRRVQGAAQFRAWLAQGAPGNEVPEGTALHAGGAGAALHDGPADGARSTESGAFATSADSEPATSADAGPFFATLGGPNAAEPPAWDRSRSFPPLQHDPVLDPTFGAERLDTEPEWATDDAAGAFTDTERGSDARAAAGIAFGPRPRRRIGLWVGAVVSMLLLVAVGGVWVFDQTPVRIDGWVRGLAAFAPGLSGHPAEPDAVPAGTARSHVPAQSSVAPLENRGSLPGALSTTAVVAAPPATVTVTVPPTVTPAATSRAAAPTPDSPALDRRERARQPTPARTLHAGVARQSVAPDRSSPRDACAGRTQFSLYRCMQTQCEQPRWTHHEQCDRLRATDRVD